MDQDSETSSFVFFLNFSRFCISFGQIDTVFNAISTLRPKWRSLMDGLRCKCQ